LKHQQRRGLCQRLLLAVQIALQLHNRQAQLPQLLRVLAPARSASGFTKIGAPLRQIMRKYPALPAPGIQPLFAQAVTLLQR
jgi:hypothetical protein